MKASIFFAYPFSAVRFIPLPFTKGRAMQVSHAAAAQNWSSAL
jgi:hypothetical protein